MFVSRYLPGQHFVRQYLSQGRIPICQNARIISARDRNDIVTEANRRAGQHLFGVRYDTAEVRFSCSGGGTSRNGYMMVVTMLMDLYGMGGVWGVEAINGYVATPEKEFIAEEVYSKMISSFEINPVWYREQQKLTANVSGIVAETGSQMFDIISKSYARTSRSQDEILRKYSNYLRGVEDVRDPEYGEQYKVWSGSNYYWIDNSGTILGTNLHANPDVGRFREMIRLD